MPHFAVCAVGSDRPGIVASVSGLLVGHGCNLEDTQMAVLRGHFAMMMIVEAPADETAERLEASLADSELVVSVRLIDDDVPASPVGEAWEVSVYGADHLGIVHRVTSYLAEAGANVTSAETRVIGDRDHPVYVMLLDVTLPSGGADVARGLRDLQAELGVECAMRPADADIL